MKKKVIVAIILAFFSASAMEYPLPDLFPFDGNYYPLLSPASSESSKSSENLNSSKSEGDTHKPTPTKQRKLVGPSALKESHYHAVCTECNITIWRQDRSIVTALKNHYLKKHLMTVPLKNRQRLVQKPSTRQHYFAQCLQPNCNKHYHSRGQASAKPILRRHHTQAHPGRPLLAKLLHVTIHPVEENAQTS